MILMFLWFSETYFSFIFFHRDCKMFWDASEQYKLQEMGIILFYYFY